jgi:hypothetical protein
MKKEEGTGVGGILGALVGGAGGESKSLSDSRKKVELKDPPKHRQGRDLGNSGKDPRSPPPAKGDWTEEEIVISITKPGNVEPKQDLGTSARGSPKGRGESRGKGRGESRGKGKK